MVVLGFLLFFMVQIEPAAAWAEPNHYEIVYQVYYTLPDDVHENLSLFEMMEGAGDPDLRFLDFQNHHYPQSQAYADYWLNQGRNYYQAGDYSNASYCFGVASHYISDGLCPPHTGGGQRGYLHTKFELEAICFTPHINTSLNQSMDELYTNSTSEWTNWIKTGDTSLIQSSLNNAVSESYIKIKDATSKKI
ncbi:MAG: hypothetical protein F8N15_07285 [Methanobacterium sp.]|nr:hypothetical protein [Methanobacterium sp.]